MLTHGKISTPELKPWWINGWWLVAEGDTVRAGQPLANVVLVKATLDIGAPTSGRIEKILVKAGETFAQGKPMALLGEAA